MREILTSGKFLAGVLALALLVLASMPLFDGNSSEVLILVLAFAGLFVFVMLALTWQKMAFSELKKRGQQISKQLDYVQSANEKLEVLKKEIEEQLPKIAEDLDRTEKAVDSTQKNIIVSLGKLGRAQGELEKKFEQQQDLIPKKVKECLQSEFDEQLQVIKDPTIRKSVYNIDSIRPMKVVKSNTPGALGRSAAIIEVDGDSSEYLRVLQNSSPEDWKPKVAAVVPEAIRSSLIAANHVVELVPDQAVSFSSRPLDYVVIDENCLSRGNWAGALETYKLSTYMDLDAFIKKAKKNGAVIIVIESEDHFAMTNSLRDLADILVKGEGTALTKNGTTANLEICRAIIGVDNSEKENNV